MVKYVITPWRNPRELLKVRDQFYQPRHEYQQQQQQQQQQKQQQQQQQKQQQQQQQQQQQGEDAIARAEKEDAVLRVQMWTGRGNCPHVVESTAMLVNATLEDEARHSVLSNAWSPDYTVRSCYSTALIRFVTGLLDGEQDKQHKMSMFSIAKKLDLPASFVELRHQATHEELPTLFSLRAAAREALQWIWNYYWKDLKDETPPRKQGPCYKDVLDHLHLHVGDEPVSSEAALSALVERWGELRLLMALMDIEDSAISSRDLSLLLKTLRLFRRLLGGGDTGTGTGTPGVDMEPEAEADAGQQVLQLMEETRQLLDTKTAALASSKKKKSDEFWPLAGENWRIIQRYFARRREQQEQTGDGRRETGDPCES